MSYLFKVETVDKSKLAYENMTHCSKCTTII